MKRATITIIFSVVYAAMVISVYQFASACQVDEFYHTKEGTTLAAATPEALHAAITFQENGNTEKLSNLLKSGTVLQLTENLKVQVVERSFEFKMLKITFPEGKDPYWVKDGSLKQIDCTP